MADPFVSVTNPVGWMTTATTSKAGKTIATRPESLAQSDVWHLVWRRPPQTGSVDQSDFGTPLRQSPGTSRDAGVTAVLIASPLDDALAERIAGADGRIELLYDPAWCPRRARWATSRRLGARSRSAGPSCSGARRSSTGSPAPRRRASSTRSAAARRCAGCRRATRAPASRWPRRSSSTARRSSAWRSCTASGVHAGPLAEFTLMGLLAFAKRLPRMQRDKARRYWPPQEQPSGELRGQTLLIVGAGAIGTEIARLAKAFGMTGAGRQARRRASPSSTWTSCTRSSGSHELAGRADALACVLPGTDATRGLIDAGVFAALKPGAVFVNVGRGTAVDEAALVDALRDGTLAGRRARRLRAGAAPAREPAVGARERASSPRTTPRGCPRRRRARPSCSATTCAATWRARSSATASTSSSCTDAMEAPSGGSGAALVLVAAVALGLGLGAAFSPPGSTRADRGAGARPADAAHGRSAAAARALGRPAPRR